MVSTRTMSNVSEGGDSLTSTTPAAGSKPVTPSLSKAVRGIVDKPPNLVEPWIQNLPLEIFEKIASFLPHRAIGQMRLVSRQMDAICGGILNFKFQRLQTLMLARFQAIKAKMPRRESARRNHPLACEADIIETLHMRLTLLQMTFGKHIERKHCCFFAGEILDECFRIINYIKVTQKLSRPYKVTDELFDLSTMAMEYFKEHIEPTLPEIAYFSGAEFLDYTSSPYTPNSNSFLTIEDSPPSTAGTSRASKAFSAPEPPQSNMVLRHHIRRMKLGMKRYNNQLVLVRRDLRNCKSKIAEQQKQILDYSSRLDDNDKKNEETSRKFSNFLQELNKCKTELQYWRSKSPAILPNCESCGKAFDLALNDDLVALADQDILPEGWPDVHVLPVDVAGKDDSVKVKDDVNEQIVSSPKKSEEPKDDDSKPILHKDLKLSKIQPYKRKWDYLSNDIGEAGGSKPKEPKMGHSKKSKISFKAGDDVFSIENHEAKQPRRVLKPRGKQLKNNLSF